MQRERRLGSLLFLVPLAMKASAVLVPPLSAQTVDPPIAVTWPAQVDDASDAEMAVDPANVDYAPTLGDPLLPSTEDSALWTLSPGDNTLIYPLGLTAPPALGAQT